jgi:drug/metabolite transporter (DMT)-like permease
MSIFLAPLALFEYYVTKSDKQVSWFTNRTDLPLPLIVHVIAAGLCWTGNLVFWVVSLKYISTVVASLLNSIQPLILAMYLCLCGKMISKYEWIGVIIAILGIFIASFNNLIATPGTMASNALIGIPFAFAAAVCDVMMVLTRRHQKKYVPLFQVILQCTVFNTTTH